MLDFGALTRLLSGLSAKRQKTNTCAMCTQVAKALETPDKYKRYAYVAASGDFRAQICPICKAIAEAIPTLQVHTFSEDVERLEIVREDTIFYFWGVRLELVGHPNSDGNCTPVMVDHQWIDTNQIRRWIHSCDTSHSGSCHTITNPWSRLDPATNLLFIDVDRQCLVLPTSQTDSCRYAALSYCCGRTGSNLFRTTHSTLGALLHDGAFEQPPDGFHIPQTVHDSMLVAKEVGIRYLREAMGVYSTYFQVGAGLVGRVNQIWSGGTVFMRRIVSPTRLLLLRVSAW
ncbi:uncharacterized protein CC84DRAFT_660484 [Paraphaeosphaeria sporulosa]|uniref:Heterokaryon incompatibility domain-containing protein n=1 Tax=Paraphaeosphaeria sporulosa TaxID=1460663 RepID=A0A177CJ04_9PLEO|nr:uncharacterized protein CC84DRAFT_660484 [Paraphaeosphaeria sporulosa]OAG07483.1 hypothetical protein CC84DRAFT_660484 [Paraphaeosphaeria sporulosa]